MNSAAASPAGPPTAGWAAADPLAAAQVAAPHPPIGMS